MARLVKASEMDRSFDHAFWKRVGAEGGFSAAWEMVLEGGDLLPLERERIRIIIGDDGCAQASA